MEKRAPRDATQAFDKADDHWMSYIGAEVALDEVQSMRRYDTSDE